MLKDNAFPLDCAGFTVQIHQLSGQVVPKVSIAPLTRSCYRTQACICLVFRALLSKGSTHSHIHTPPHHATPHHVLTMALPLLTTPLGPKQGFSGLNHRISAVQLTISKLLDDICRLVTWVKRPDTSPVPHIFPLLCLSFLLVSQLHVGMDSLMCTHTYVDIQRYAYACTHTQFIYICIYIIYICVLYVFIMARMAQNSTEVAFAPTILYSNPTFQRQVLVFISFMNYQ